MKEAQSEVQERKMHEEELQTKLLAEQEHEKDLEASLKTEHAARVRAENQLVCH